MCSTGNDGPDLDTLTPRVDAIGRTCMKCSASAAVVVVRLNDPLCKSCFLTYFTHKFRSTIGKARAVRHDERVLLALSGGPSSLAMVDLVNEGVSDRAARKLRFQPGVVYINEGTVLGSSDEEKTQHIKEISQMVTDKGFTFHCVDLEDVFQPHLMVLSGQQDDNKGYQAMASNTLALESLFESVTTMTAKEDLLKSLRRELLVQVAHKEGYTKIMVGDCANKISVCLLSDISQGRGAALPFGTAFVDSRHSDISVLRPMREFIAKEISLYNFFNGIEAIHIPSLTSKSNTYVSIDRLTEEFISGLQAQFPFTVSTVFRTGDKLAMKEQTDDAHQCALCGIPVPALDTPLCRSFEQLMLDTQSDRGSNVLSSDHKTTVVSQECCGSGGCTKDSSLHPLEPTRINLAEILCYGCRLTLKDTKGDVISLPFVMDRSNRSIIRDKMRQEIEEFLLPDEASSQPTS